VEQLNAKIAAKTLQNRHGRTVSDPIGAALIREDKQFAYVIRNDIPVMLVDEAVPLTDS
jgi:uncharacterized protein YbaR (Trm112 family)